MKKELANLEWENFSEFETLKECFNVAIQKAENNAEKSIILFSPSSKSFEKFKNEYDRGEKFNLLVLKYKNSGNSVVPA